MKAGAARAALPRRIVLRRPLALWTTVRCPVSASLVGLTGAVRSKRELFDVATEDTASASVPARYAAALYVLAEQQNEVQAVERDLTTIRTLLADSADLQRLVLSPVFRSNDQAKALAVVLEKAGVGRTAGNLVKVLARNRRLSALDDIIGTYRAIAAKARGEVSAEVVSAQPLTAAQLDALRETLKGNVGKSVAINAKVDPSLLGGLVVKIGSRMIDSSLRTKVNSLKVAMKGTA
jgi:F-type H+-transporting ATPase subunit delta